MSYPRQVLILYRRILELHRYLPENAREIGNTYVKEEFRLHRNVDTLMRNRFLMEWEVCSSITVATSVGVPRENSAVFR